MHKHSAPVRFVAILMMGLFLMPAAYGWELAIGFLAKTHRVSDIMYYRDGAWVKPAPLNHQLYGSDGADMETYAKNVWGAGSSTFRKWFLISDQHSAPVKSIYAFVGGAGVDCGEDAAVIHVDYETRTKTNTSGWVASTQSGLLWSKFEEIAYVYVDPDTPSKAKNDPRIKPVPPALNRVVTQVEKKWSEVEGGVVSEINAAKDGYPALKQALRATRYKKLSIRGAPVPGGTKTLLFFDAMKIVTSPLLDAASSGDDSVYVQYQAWALANGAGEIEWVLPDVVLHPGANATVARYVEIAPQAVIELDKKRYLIQHIHQEGGSSVTEISEITASGLTTSGIYMSTCD